MWSDKQDSLKHIEAFTPLLRWFCCDSQQLLCATYCRRLNAWYFPPVSRTEEGQSRKTPSILHLQSSEWFHFDLTMSQAVCRFAEVITLTPLFPPWDQCPKIHNVTVSPQHFVVGKLLHQQQRGYSKVSPSSAVPSDRQYLHTGEAVGILRQHHRVAVHTHLIEAWS